MHEKHIARGDHTAKQGWTPPPKKKKKKKKKKNKEKKKEKKENTRTKSKARLNIKHHVVKTTNPQKRRRTPGLPP